MQKERAVPESGSFCTNLGLVPIEIRGEYMIPTVDTSLHVQPFKLAGRPRVATCSVPNLLLEYRKYAQASHC